MHYTGEYTAFSSSSHSFSSFFPSSSVIVVVVGNSIIRHRTLTDNCQVTLSHSQICVQSIELYMVSVSYMKRTLPLVNITQIRYALHRWVYSLFILFSLLFILLSVVFLRVLSAPPPPTLSLFFSVITGTILTEEYMWPSMTKPVMWDFSRKSQSRYISIVLHFN